MTDRRAALVERVADLVRFNHDPIAIANEAIDLIRAETLEEAARVCDKVSTDVWTQIGRDHELFMRATAEDCAKIIRALKGDTNDV